MILLAKHSQPAVDPSTSPSAWTLSTAGRRRALALAASLRHHNPTRIVASPETKAIETAEIVGASLHLEVEVLDGVREHDRPLLAFATSRDAFESAIEASFARPEEVIYGGESIETASRRLHAAIGSVLASPRGGTPLVVTHGTVLAAYVAAITDQNPFLLWRRLDLPSWIALDVDARVIVDSWRVVPDGG